MELDKLRLLFGTLVPPHQRLRLLLGLRVLGLKKFRASGILRGSGSAANFFVGLRDVGSRVL